ncbi:hypothetical protein JCM19000A_33110 [Silvimonas sp. JCM 19000]
MVKPLLLTLLSLALTAPAYAENTSVRAVNIQLLRGQAVAQCKKKELPAGAADVLAKLQIELDRNAFCGCVGSKLKDDKRINALISGADAQLDDDGLKRVLEARAAAAGFSCLGQQIDTATAQ